MKADLIIDDIHNMVNDIMNYIKIENEKSSGGVVQTLAIEGIILKHLKDFGKSEKVEEQESYCNEGNYTELNGVKRAKENMKGGSGKEINGKRYYTFQQAIDTAKEQGLTIPTKQDFLDSGFTEERTKENEKLADKLGLTLDGRCGSDGKLIHEGRDSSVWSSSEFNSYFARDFEFNEGKGMLDRDDRDDALAVRPVLKNSSIEAEIAKGVEGIEKIKFNWDMPATIITDKLNEIITVLNSLIK